MGDCNCDPEEEFRQAQEALQKLAHRLADGRLRYCAQKIKQQKKWDNAPRHTEYQGHNVNNGGLVKSLGGDAVTRQPISNGWLSPGDVVEVGSKGGFDFKPRARKQENEEGIKRNLPLKVIKDFVGESYRFENFKAILQSRKNADSQFKDADLNFSKIENTDVFHSGISRRMFTSRDEYQIIETLPSGFYLSFQAQKDFVFGSNEQTKYNNSALAYLCNCKPKTIYKFISKKGTVQNLSFLFSRPHKEYRRSKCSDFKDFRSIKGFCDGGIVWRLIELGAAGENSVVYANGKVSESGYLITESVSGTYLFDPFTKAFASTYEYPGYMQLQIGCNDVIGGGNKWK